MKFCADHGRRLREEITRRGLAHLTAGGGKAPTLAECEAAATSRANFDPLLAASFVIAANVARTLTKANFPAAALITVSLGGGCPLCRANELHRDWCTAPGCKLDKVAGYDWMLARAADDALSRARSLGLLRVAR